MYFLWVVNVLSSDDSLSLMNESDDDSDSDEDEDDHGGWLYTGLCLKSKRVMLSKIFHCACNSVFMACSPVHI